MGAKFIDFKTLGSQMAGAGIALTAAKTVNELTDKATSYLTFIPETWRPIAKGLAQVLIGAKGPGYAGKIGKGELGKTAGSVMIGEGVRTMVNGIKPGFLAGPEDAVGNNDEDISDDVSVGDLDNTAMNDDSVSGPGSESSPVG